MIVSQLPPVCQMLNAVSRRRNEAVKQIVCCQRYHNSAKRMVRGKIVHEWILWARRPNGSLRNICRQG